MIFVNLRPKNLWKLIPQVFNPSKINILKVHFVSQSLNNILFLQPAIQAEAKRENGETLEFYEYSKITGSEWKGLPLEEKQVNMLL